MPPFASSVRTVLSPPSSWNICKTGSVTVNAPTRPAHAGDIVALLAAGAGQLAPPAMDGEISEGAMQKPVLQVRVHLQAGLTNADAEITYAGEAPTLVSGVLQVNFRVPVINAYGPPPYYVYLDLDIGAFRGNSYPVLVITQ